jgi:segregation and condensation protein B
MSFLPQIQAILFVASKPLSLREIAEAVGTSQRDVADMFETLKAMYNHPDSGVHVLFEDDRIRMATNPEYADAVQGFIKQETDGELTKAQLETLTVVAYQGPVTRPEIERIRGVNCAIILRNLLVRGLLEERGEVDALFPTYIVSFDALAHLGIHSVEELPDYEELHGHAYIEEALKQE